MKKEKNKEDIQQEAGDYEELFKTIVTGYQEACNRYDQILEIKFTATITTHKKPTPEGNKDIAYLRINKHTRPKESEKEEDWTEIPLHQEIYIFRNMKERVSKTSQYREQLFGGAVARLVSGGLEYAETLQLVRKEREAELKKQEAAKPDILITSQMPNDLSEGDKAYAEYIKKEKAKL